MKKLPTVSGGTGPRFVRHSGAIACIRAPEGDPGELTPEALSEADCDASILLYRELVDTNAPETVLARLTALGVRAIIALGLEARFYERCVGHGLLPVILDQDALEELESRVASGPGVPTTIDLEAQVIERPDMEAVPFGVDPRARNKLLLGLTDLDEALRYRKEGAALRDEDRKRRPWLYGKP